MGRSNAVPGVAPGSVLVEKFLDLQSANQLIEHGFRQWIALADIGEDDEENGAPDAPNQVTGLCRPAHSYDLAVGHLFDAAGPAHDPINELS